MIEQKDAVIEQKSMMVASEKAHKDEFMQFYREQLEAKELELSKANQEKEKANQEKDRANQQAQEANKRAQEAVDVAVSLSSRADRLQKEKDALTAKYNAALKGHEQSVKNHGKHGPSQLGNLPPMYMQSGKRAATDADAEAARKYMHEYAKIEAQKRARKE